MTFRIWGNEDWARQVNGVSVDRSTVMKLHNGGYVVLWRESTASPKIMFQLYNGEGQKVGGAQFVDNTTGNTQRFADAQVYGFNGGFAVTWSEDIDATTSGVYTRRFTFSGEQDGGRITVGTGIGSQDGASMSSDANGGWATAYAQATGIQLFRYNAAGQVLGTVQVTNGTPMAYKPDVVHLGGTKYVVAYRSSGNNDIRFKIVDGATVGAEITFGAGDNVDVVALKDPVWGSYTGEFVVVRDAGDTIAYQRYSSTGAAIGAPVTVTSDVQDSGYDYASITALKDGGFAIVYLDKSTNPNGSVDYGDVFIRVADAQGNLGQPMRLNARAAVDSFGGQDTPMVVEMADGRLAVTWHDATYANGIIGTTIVDARTTKVIVSGTPNDDIYVGSDYAGDLLQGGNGNDKLIGGLGGDALDGGGGIDTASYQYATAGVVANLYEGDGFGGEAAGDTYTSIENLLGSAYGDTLVGNGIANVLTGGGGNDWLEGGEGADRLIGGDGTDTAAFQGSAAGVWVSLTAGSGSGGDATGDTYSSIENLYGSIHGDTLTGDANGNSLTGWSGNDVLFGVAGADALYGGAGADQLYGGLNNDYLDGGTENDHLLGEGGADALYGGSGNDYLDGGTDNDVLSGDAGLDRLYGGSGNDRLNGGNEDDLLHGGTGNDVILGGYGNDKIYGSSGIDTLYGQSGKDIFVFNSALSRKANLDRIADFNVKDDTIWLDNAVFKKLGKGTEAKPYKLNKAYFAYDFAKDKNDFVIYDRKKGILYYDIDGSGSKAAVEVAVLKKGLKFTYADFFVV